MQNLERRLISLEAAKVRQLERLTDSELDQRITALLAQMPTKLQPQASDVSLLQNAEGSMHKPEGTHAKP